MKDIDDKATFVDEGNVVLIDFVTFLFKEESVLFRFL